MGFIRDKYRQITDYNEMKTITLTKEEFKTIIFAFIQLVTGYESAILPVRITNYLVKRVKVQGLSEYEFINNKFTSLRSLINYYFSMLEE